MARIKTQVLARVAAGAATNNTFYYYLDMQEAGTHFQKAGVQFEWTPGGTGTVTVTIEATVQDDGTAAASCAYRDITTGTFGVASWTDDFMAIDNAERLACFRHIRVKVVTLTTDANTAWTLYAKQIA